MLIKQFIVKQKKTILIVDDYVDIKTLQLMKSSKNNVKISIISDNKAKNKLVENYIKDFEKDTKNKIELRPNNGKFHDRYIVLDLGTINETIFHCGSSSKYDLMYKDMYMHSLKCYMRK